MTLDLLLEEPKRRRLPEPVAADPLAVEPQRRRLHQPVAADPRTAVPAETCAAEAAEPSVMLDPMAAEPQKRRLSCRWRWTPAWRLL
jgi:hypothetical protein